MTSLPTLFLNQLIAPWLAPDAQNIPIQASTGLLPSASRDSALLLILFIVYYTALALDYLISWYLQTVWPSAQHYLSSPEPKEMNPAMAHKSPQPTRQGFAIFDDGSPMSKAKHTNWTAAADSAVLRELSKGKIQSRAVPVLDAAASPLTKSPRRESPCLEVKPTKAESVRFTACDQQSQAHSESFEPLVAVPEESSLVEIETGDAMAVQSPTKSGENRGESVTCFGRGFAFASIIAAVSDSSWQSPHRSWTKRVKFISLQSPTCLLRSRWTNTSQVSLNGSWSILQEWRPVWLQMASFSPDKDPRQPMPSMAATCFQFGDNKAPLKQQNYQLTCSPS